MADFRIIQFILYYWIIISDALKGHYIFLEKKLSDPSWCFVKVCILSKTFLLHIKLCDGCAKMYFFKSKYDRYVWCFELHLLLPFQWQSFSI